MVLNAENICLIVSLILFGLAAVGIPLGKIDKVAAGLLFFMASILIGRL